MTADKIIEELGIEESVIAIFPYGSRVYGTANSQSDHDFIIVTKGAFLESGSMKDNAISNEDKSIQGVLYSRGGFISGMEEYEIGVLECLALAKEDMVLSTPFFEKFVLSRTPKWDTKAMVKKIIQKASASWFIAERQVKEYDQPEFAKKGIFHAIRILTFGLQLKEHQKIVDLSECNEFYFKLKSIPPEEFNFKKLINRRNRLMEKLRE